MEYCNPFLGSVSNILYCAGWPENGSKMLRGFLGNGSVKSEKDFIYCTAKSSEESNVRYFAENGIICVDGIIFVTNCCETLK